MTVLTDLLTSLFNFSVYKNVARRGLGRAFLHLFLLVIIYSFGFSVFMNKTVLTEINDFISWASENFPSVYISGKTLSTDAQEPLFLNYKEGLVSFVFSTKQDYGDLGSLEENTVVIENQRILFVGPDNQVTPYDLDNLQQLDENLAGTIDKKSLEQLDKVINRFFSPVVFFAILIVSIFAFLMVSFLWSLVGALLNLIIRAKIKYDGVYSVAIYSLTAVNLMVFLGFLFPAFNFPFRNVVGLALIFFYLIVGLVVNRGE